MTRKFNARRHHRLRQRVAARRTEYELSWEVVERRAGTGAVAWESPIGGRIVRVDRREYYWRSPVGTFGFWRTRRECIERGKRFATPEQLAVIPLRKRAAA